MLLHGSNKTEIKCMDESKQNTRQILRDEVLRKIGSNLLLFQQIEGLLKLLLGTSQVQGTASTMIAYQQQRIEEIQKRMMGLLVKKYIDEILSEPDSALQEPKDLSLPWISCSFKTAGDSKFNELQSKSLKMMVDERNELVHHFLPRWQPDSPDHMADASSYLDKQRERVLPVWEHLVSVVNAKQRLVNLVASNEWSQRFELLLLQESPLIRLLLEIATQISRSDGWTYLAHAGKFAHMQLADDVVNMKEIYGYGTFKKLLIASELFEIFDEPLPAGGLRTLYRVRSKKFHFVEIKQPSPYSG